MLYFGVAYFLCSSLADGLVSAPPKIGSGGFPATRGQSVQRGQPDAASLLFPQSLEAPAGNARVVHGVARITMAEVILHGPQIGALVGEIVAARVAQRVRVNVEQANPFCGDADQILRRGACQGLAAFG